MILSSLKRAQARTLLIAGITVLMLLGAGIGAVVLEENSYRAYKIENVRAQANMLASIVPAALAFGNQDELREYLRALAISTDIRAAAIYDNEGNIAAETARLDEPPPSLKKPESLQIHDNTITVTVAIAQRGLHIGHVYLSAEIEPIKRRFALYALMIVMSLIGAFVVLGLAIAYLMQRNAAHELQRRAEALAQTNSELENSIAAREKIEAALRQAHKMEALGQMTGGMAHDFNNLLHLVKLNLTSILWTYKDESHKSLQDIIQACIKTVERGAALTQQLLAFARRQPLSPRLLDVNVLIEQCAPLIQPILGASIRLEVNKSPVDCGVVADPHQLENALLNLAINARDAMPDGGQLSISCGIEHIENLNELTPGDYVAIRVKDTGAGIAPSVLDKVFEPFFTTKHVGKGSGLGLSQVYGYVKQSGGDVIIETAENVGTCITLLLAAAVLPNSSQPVSAVTAPPTSIKRSTILIVEDEESTMIATAEVVKSLGLRVFIASNADEALTLLKTYEPIDILFSDIILPGTLNGLQLALQTQQINPNIKILLTTGYAGEAALGTEHLKQFTLLRKPYGVDELRNELTKLSS